MEECRNRYTPRIDVPVDEWAGRWGEVKAILRFAYSTAIKSFGSWIDGWGGWVGEGKSCFTAI